MSRAPSKGAADKAGSKERMVEATAALLRRQGYHATGLNQIVREASAPKGSLYFHFPGGKESLAATALQASGARMKMELAALVGGCANPPQAVAAVVEHYARELAESSYENGCPMATVVLEAAATSDTLQEVCTRHYEEWQSLIAAYLLGHGYVESDARDLAGTILSSFEGALLLARAHRSPAPLEQIGRTLTRLLDAYAPATSTPSA